MIRVTCVFKMILCSSTAPKHFAKIYENAYNELVFVKDLLKLV